MLDQPTLIDTLNQRLLAAFLCSVAMRIERSGEMRAIPAGDIEYLRKHRQPTQEWWVGLMRYQEDNPHDYWFSHAAMHISATPAMPPSLGPKDCNTQVTTLVAGKMCAHIFSSTVWDGFLGYEGANLTVIWPPASFDVDSRHIDYLDNAGLPLLHWAIATACHNPEAV